jgi:hypothetical protein
VSDQPHRHGDIETVLGEETRHIPLDVTVNPGLDAGVLTRDKVKKSKHEEEDESGKNKLLTLHCVVPQKNGS